MLSSLRLAVSCWTACAHNHCSNGLQKMCQFWPGIKNARAQTYHCYHFLYWGWESSRVCMCPFAHNAPLLPLKSLSGHWHLPAACTHTCSRSVNSGSESHESCWSIYRVTCPRFHHGCMQKWDSRMCQTWSHGSSGNFSLLAGGCGGQTP